jgi:hypothetical protein
LIRPKTNGYARGVTAKNGPQPLRTELFDLALHHGLSDGYATRAESAICADGELALSLSAHSP